MLPGDPALKQWPDQFPGSRPLLIRFDPLNSSKLLYGEIGEISRSLKIFCSQCRTNTVDQPLEHLPRSDLPYVNATEPFERANRFFPSDRLHGLFYQERLHTAWVQVDVRLDVCDHADGKRADV